jgi:hypothetical protein
MPANQRAAVTDVLGDAAGLRHAFRACSRARGRLQGVEAAGVGRDESGVGPAFPQHDVQQAVEQHHVGAGQQGQVQVGHAGGVGAARVGDDDLQRRVGLLRVLDAAKQHRVRKGGVAAGDEQAVGVVDVVVAGRRRVGAQRELVAGHRAAHAQARVGVDVVGADQALGQLVEDVVVLGQQLAADVEAHGVGAVRLDDAGELRAGVVQRGVPARDGCGGAPRCARASAAAAGSGA